MGINILGIGSAMPEHILTNEDLTKIIDTSDEWIYSRTGIKQRHIATDEKNWEIAARASKSALDRSGVSADEIGVIICSTISPDFWFPSTACVVQREIKATNAFAFDLAAACTGFVYAVDVAEKYLRSFNFNPTNNNGDIKNTAPPTNKAKYALVVGSEILTKLIDFSDRASCVLFGDGAAAAVLEYSDGIYGRFLGSDGQGAKHIYAHHINTTPTPFCLHGDHSHKYANDHLEPPKDTPPLRDIDVPHHVDEFLHQDGKEVYKFASKILVTASERALENAGVTKEDIKYFIPHQANMRIIETAAKNFGLPTEKFYVTIEKYGNTSSSSIPIALNDAVEKGLISKGDKICMVGFGSGLTYASVVFEF
jgi:3-oxoacyl-[acyl-carrier-protein] synthase-3